MSEIVRSGLSFRRVMLPKDEAIQLFHHKGETYKVELIEGFNTEDISLYSQGEFIDLCLGPHVPNSGFIKAFKLTRVSGAYWRGKEHNRLLQRICGTAFASEEALEHYLRLRQDENKRDHPRLGRDSQMGRRRDYVTNVLSFEEFMEGANEKVRRHS
jgi:threonyl-tRNA synthetase